ncbi:DUF3558 domain-containing protein [Streptomyces gardneri]|jgi:hypothetical protein|uniref:DUF3558 domain-containing protein n=1 Tax=Nocardia TaxID=1817 RepID=UPI001358CCAB|nr:MULTISPECIES: DUF3558 domain-containing protein [Nocardia]MBF6169120.1 DUF3558 domain-containing protein [Streptomyces gardneri]MBF6207320.1 DUF3558 domain-containing protein [Streptomyces gardneri]
MRIKSAVVIATALLLALTACGSDEQSQDSGPSRPAPKVVALGPFVGECGHVTDDEVRTLGGLGQISGVFRNAVGCNWQSAGIGSPSITFASYRGSPIERERAWVTVNGRAPDPIKVAGRDGFAALDPGGQICDLAVQLGDDFFEWSTSFGFFSDNLGNPCDRSRALAELTLQRLQ